MSFTRRRRRRPISAGPCREQLELGQMPSHTSAIALTRSPSRRRGRVSRRGRRRGRRVPTGRPCRRRRSSSRRRGARLPSCSHHRKSCGDRAVPLTSGTGSCPARGTGSPCHGPRGAPASSRIVGTRSMTWPGACRRSRRAADALRPVDDQRRGDAAFVDPRLVPAERRVAQARPARPEAEERRRRCRTRHGRVVAVAADHDLGARAVVGQEEDSVLSSGCIASELVEHAADLAVHAVDHRRVDGHLVAWKRLWLAVSVGPTAAGGSLRWARASCIASGKRVRRADVALDRRRATVPPSFRSCSRSSASSRASSQPARYFLR